MAAEWEPTVDDVKSLIPTRATGGPFSSETKPTEAQVLSLIEGATAQVEGAVGLVPDDERIQRLARWAAALAAAFFVEQGLFPEQQSDGGTADRLDTQYNKQLEALRDAVKNYGQVEARQTVGTVRTPSATALALERYPWDR